MVSGRAAPLLFLRDGGLGVLTLSLSQHLPGPEMVAPASLDHSLNQKKKKKNVVRRKPSPDFRVTEALTTASVSDP